jgi:hypothetical protein
LQIKWDCPTFSLRLLIPPNNEVGINVASWLDYVYSKKKWIVLSFGALFCTPYPKFEVHIKELHEQQQYGVRSTNVCSFGCLLPNLTSPFPSREQHSL